jgi:hypothetical protein
MGSRPRECLSQLTERGIIRVFERRDRSAADHCRHPPISHHAAAQWIEWVVMAGSRSHGQRSLSSSKSSSLTPRRGRPRRPDVDSSTTSSSSTVRSRRRLGRLPDPSRAVLAKAAGDARLDEVALRPAAGRREAQSGDHRRPKRARPGRGQGVAQAGSLPSDAEFRSASAPGESRSVTPYVACQKQHPAAGSPHRPEGPAKPPPRLKTSASSTGVIP